MSLEIGKIKKIPIKLHFTLIIVFFLISWTLASGFMPRYFPDLTDTQYWIMGIIGAIVLFVSVLLHELSHSLLSIRYGIKVNHIILFIFGGISDIKDNDEKKSALYSSFSFRISTCGICAVFGEREKSSCVFSQW